MEKKNVTVLLAKIDSKLNLLQAMVAQYETQIPTLAARIRQAKIHLQRGDIDALFIDVSWITRTILSRKALRKQFEHQTLDLHLLKEELTSFLTLTSRSQLNTAVAHWRKKLLRSLESLEHDLRMIKEQAGGVESAKSFTHFVSAQSKMKDILLVPSVDSVRNESDIISLLSIMTREVSAVNSLLSSVLLSFGVTDPVVTERVQALRGVLLQDWNTLLKWMTILFAEAYKEVKPAPEIRIVPSRTGVSELSIQK